jgi:1-acyl-sn-glycerol-3-phosphate acyltransferase
MPALDRYKPPLFNRVSRTMLHPVFIGLFRLLARIELHGLGNIPLGKPYVVVFNHVSTFDPPFLLTFWPETLEVLGASDIWNRFGYGQNLLVRLFGGIPVHRGEYDRQALERVTRILKSGQPLLISPEGGRTRTPGMRRGRPGLAHIIEEARVPVVPVGIVGTTSDFFVRAIRAQRPALSLRVGSPIHLPPLEEKGEARRLSRQHNVDLVMRAVAELLPEEYRGVYADADHGNSRSSPPHFGV